MHLNITTIHEADNPCLKDYHNIREKDLVGRKQQFIAEGKIILSALLHSKIFSALSLLIVTERLPGLMPLLEETKPTCPVYCVPQKIMDNIAGFHVHRGILGTGERITLPPLQNLLQNLPKQALILILCGISNHNNTGALFRNAVPLPIMALSLTRPLATHFTVNQSECLLVQFSKFPIRKVLT